MKNTKTFRIISVICLIFAAFLVFTACTDTKPKITFTVDSQEYATIETNGNEAVYLPQTPTKEGYTFDGWFYDYGTWQIAFTEFTLLNQSLTEDVSVYAKFTANSPTHEHTFSYTWQYDENEHWHPATCIHYNEKSSLGTHDFDKTDKCKICKYVILRNMEISTSDFVVKGTTLTTEVPNDQKTFSFISSINVKDGATFVVANDISANQIVRSKTVNLEIGNNTFYILVENGAQIRLYTATIKRKRTFTVTFNTNGGTPCQSQTVDEGGLATAPETTKDGYTFSGWDYNFSNPISSDIVINASWTKNENILDTIQYVTITQELTAGRDNTSQHIYGDCNQYFDGKIIKVQAEPYLGFDWCGWYLDNRLLTEDKSYVFRNLTTETAIIAKFTVKNDIIDYIYSSTASTCSIQGSLESNISIADIPNYVTSIDSYAFYNRKNLIRLTIPNSVMNIGDLACSGCISLTDITIPDSAMHISSNAFSGCSNISSATIPVSALGVIPKSNLQTLILTGETAITQSIISNNLRALKSLRILSNTPNIGANAFTYCTNLTLIRVPKTWEIYNITWKEYGVNVYEFKTQIQYLY